MTDGGSRPGNCEYPWVDAAGTLHTPVDHTFPNLSALYTPLGTALLKTLERAVNRLSAE